MPQPSSSRFIIIGAGKSGTTTLARWLGAQPEVTISEPKEPNYFSDPDRWARGDAWYASLFRGAAPDQLLGEASTSYTDPPTASLAAARIQEAFPDVRLLYVVRHPIERLRSQYRYRLARGVETSPLAKAVRVPGNRYVGRSLYGSCLEPYLDRFPASQIAVVRFEDLVSAEAPAWHAVLRHLGLDERPCPGTTHNPTAQVASPPWLVRTWRRVSDGHRAPSILRPLTRWLKGSRSAPSQRLLARSRAPMPPDLEALIWADVQRLEVRLGVSPLWERPAEPQLS